MSDGAFDRLCAACGMEPGYHDGLGEWRVAPQETREAILRAMGIDPARPEEALAAIERKRWMRVLEPANLLRAGDPAPTVRVHLPRATAHTVVRWRILEESGAVRDGVARLDPAHAVEGWEDRIALALPLPSDLSPGYHVLEIVEGREGVGRSTLVVAPERCYVPPEIAEGARLWGCSLQLYGVRSRRNAGIGDFTDLDRAAEAWARRGAGLIGTNPLHALSLRDPGQASPYRPSSRLFSNALYLDVEAIGEFRDLAAKDASFAARWQETCAPLRAADEVDYVAVAAAKRAMFETLYRQFREAHVLRGTARARAFDNFRASRGAALRRHAVHDALRDAHDGPWTTWPAAYRDASSAAVRRFAEEHADAVGLHEYLQWQLDLQLAHVQRRCRDLGMPVGVYADLAVSVAPDGSETWGHRGVYAEGVSVGAPPDAFAVRGQSWGLPPFLPEALRATGYAAFAAMLRANMAHAGALRIDHVMALERLFWIPDGMDASQGAYVRYPLEHLLGVVALESQRSRCLVVGEDLGTVSETVRAALARAGVLSYRLLLFEREGPRFKAPGEFPQQALAAWSTHDLPTLAGWWEGRDIEARATLELLPPETAQAERASRAQSREALMGALAAERLPARGTTAAKLGEDTALAVHELIARTPSVLMAMQMEDVLGVLEQANLPGTVHEHPNWRRKLPLDVEDWGRDPRFRKLTARLAAVRGRPDARRRSAQPRIPRATYRLQLHAGFGFRDAADLVPYLGELGVSHVYCSPYLKARAGSTHGYDVVDHSALNPELGSREDFARFVAALGAHGMSQMIDIVPNHMVVLEADNAWWRDVLQFGETSRYAGYFDIDWQPPSEHLHARVLLPILGERYGRELAAGKIRVGFDAARGEPCIEYFAHRLPIDPESAPELFGGDAESAAPFIERLNGTAGDPASFDGLHALLEAQHYRLAYWRVAHDEINYRRFFDINELAALRQEHPGVFEATHALWISLVRDGTVDALRIDHPDGLFDPREYFERLQHACGRPTYVAIEKILAPFEELPADWSVHGTTGYRFANLATGLFVDPAAEGRLTRTYQAFIGDDTPFAEVTRRSRRLVAASALASEVTVLANRLARIAQADRETRDFTFAALREGIADVLAAFPVYRTYIDGGVQESDRAAIDWAIGSARASRRASDPEVFAFIRDALTGELAAAHPGTAAAIRHFARKFQQVSAPVMAKGVEDTAFYRYNRLVSLNDVGGDPDDFGVTAARFHRAIARHSRRWPHTMLATSTHDNKRSEDVRARICVISEMPAAWRLRLRKWQRMNAGKAREAGGVRAPSRNDEYLLYQTLLGSFPLAEDASLAEYRERIVAYMRKAAREAKVHTSWANVDAPYEEGLAAFVEALLDDSRANPFLEDLRSAVGPVAWIGFLNSLSATLLKYTAPGVPDCYQGNETWDFSLVDPDNRRPVDFARRRGMLGELRRAVEANPGDVAGLFENLADGRAKMFVVWRLLQLRREREDLFTHGSYAPIAVRGPRAAHVVAFARRHEGATLVVAVPRLCARLGVQPGELPCGARFWADTVIEIPAARGAQARDVFTGVTASLPADGRVRVADLFAQAPLAALLAE